MVDPIQWQKLAGALREVHRTLLERARRDYEREHFVTLTPGELLQLLTTRAEFEWLRGLSELMVDVDLIGDAAPLHRDELATAMRPAVEHLLSKTPDPATPPPSRGTTGHMCRTIRTSRWRTRRLKTPSTPGRRRHNRMQLRYSTSAIDSPRKRATLPVATSCGRFMQRQPPRYLI